jgi:hypothetical protein
MLWKRTGSVERSTLPNKYMQHCPPYASTALCCKTTAVELGEKKKVKGKMGRVIR